jgi:hypothetical protein
MTKPRQKVTAKKKKTAKRGLPKNSGGHKDRFEQLLDDVLRVPTKK